MKLRITFELDLKGTSYNIKKVKLIPICLQNLGSWFYKLHLSNLTNQCDTLFRITSKDCSYNERMKKALMKSAEEDLKLSEQLFHNYKVEGTTDDGEKFEFTHSEPGYKEKTLVNGVEVTLEAYDED